MARAFQMANRWLAPGLWRETVSPVDAPPGQRGGGGRRGVEPAHGQVLPEPANFALGSLRSYRAPLHAMLDSAVGGRSPPEGGKASWAIGSGWDGDSKAAPGSRSFWVLPAEGDQMRRGVGMHATRREQAAARPLRFTAQTGGGQDQRSWWRGQLGGAAAFGQHAWRRAMAGAQPMQQKKWLHVAAGPAASVAETAPAASSTFFGEHTGNEACTAHGCSSGRGSGASSVAHQRSKCGEKPAQSSGVGVQGTGYIPYTSLPRFQEVARVGEHSQGHHEVLTGECGPGTQARRAAQDAGTAERAELSNYDFVISLVDSINCGAQLPLDSIHYGAQLPLESLALRPLAPLRGSLSAAENFVGFRWLVLVHNMKKTTKEAAKRAALKESRKMKEKELQEELKEAAQKKALNLASWEEAENEKDQQKKLRAEQQRRLQEEQKGEEAEMKREMAQLQKKISSLKIEASDVTIDQAKTIDKLLAKRQALPPSDYSTQERRDLYTYELKQVWVKCREERDLIQKLAPLRARQMLDRRGQEEERPGRVLIAISEAEDLGNLDKNHVFEFMRTMMPSLTLNSVRGITTTKKDTHSTEAVPRVYEVEILPEDGLTEQLLSAITTERHIKIVGKKCIWGFESSVTVPVRFDHEERLRLFTMWKVCQTYGLTPDDFDMFLTATVRAALRAKGTGLEDFLMVVGFQRYSSAKKGGTETRLLAADLPPLRVMVTGWAARQFLSGIHLQVALGQNYGDCLLRACGRFQDEERDNKQVGVDAAKERALSKARATMQGVYDMLSVTEEQVKLAQQICEEDAGTPDAMSKLESVIHLLRIEVIKNSSIRDVTANFVQYELSAALEKMDKEDSVRFDPMTWTSLRAFVSSMKVEVERRRGLLNELLLVRVFPFPEPDKIWMQKQDSKAAIKEMRPDAATAFAQLLDDMNASFLAVEPVTFTMRSGKLGWDYQQGVIMIVQSVLQLRNFDKQQEQLGKGQPAVFTANKEGAAGNTSYEWKDAQMRQESIAIQSLKGRVPLVRKKNEPEFQMVKITILSEARGVRAILEDRASIKLYLERTAVGLYGIWVPRQHYNDGESAVTIVRPAEGQTATPLRLLGTTRDPFHISNIRNRLQLESEEAYDETLSVLGELEASNILHSVAVDEQYVVYLRTPIATEFRQSKLNKEDWVDRLVMGESTYRVMLDMATSHLLETLRAHAAGGVWLHWNAGGEGADSRVVGILKESQEHIDKQGARWIARLAKASALVVMGEIDDDWSLLQKAVDDILRKSDSLFTAFRGDEVTSLILFKTTIYGNELAKCEARPGFPLPEMEIPPLAYERFKRFMSRIAQGRGKEWQIVKPDEQQAECWQHLEALPAGLIQQWKDDPEGPLRLTWSELHELEKTSKTHIGPFCALRDRAQDGQLMLRVKPHGPGVVAVAASGSGDNVLEIKHARVEWTTNMRERQQTHEQVTWLTDLLEHDWHDLLQGTTATRMIQQMINEGLAYVVQVRNAFVVIFPETIHRFQAAAQQSSEFEVAKWVDQFGSIEAVGKEIKRFTALKAPNVPLTDILGGIRDIVHTKSTITAQVRVEEILGSSICILPGMQAVQAQEQLVMRYVGQNVAGAGGVPDLRAEGRHPAMFDTRCAEITQAGVDLADVIVRHVGKRLTCLLFIPGTEQTCILTWKQDDVRFQQWDAMTTSIEDLNAIPASQGASDTSMPAASKGQSKKSARRTDNETSAGAESETAMGDTSAAEDGVEEDAAERCKRRAGTGHE